MKFCNASILAVALVLFGAAAWGQQHAKDPVPGTEFAVGGRYYALAGMQSGPIVKLTLASTGLSSGAWRIQVTSDDVLTGMLPGICDSVHKAPANLIPPLLEHLATLLETGLLEMSSPEVASLQASSGYGVADGNIVSIEIRYLERDDGVWSESEFSYSAPSLLLGRPSFAPPLPPSLQPMANFQKWLLEHAKSECR